MDLDLALRAAGVAREVVVQRLVTPPVGGLDPVEAHVVDGVEERIGRGVLAVSPDRERVHVAFADRGSRHRHRDGLASDPGPSHRVGEGDERAALLAELRPGLVRAVEVAPDPVPRDRDGVRGVELVGLEAQRVGPRVVELDLRPLELIRERIRREQVVGEVLLPVLAPGIRRQRREARDVAPAGTRRHAQPGAVHRGRVDDLGIAPQSLRPRGARALRPALREHEDPVHVVEDAVAVPVVDLDRQLDRHVRRIGARDEFVAMDAHLRDRDADRKALRDQLGIRQLVDAGRVELDSDFGIVALRDDARGQRRGGAERGGREPRGAGRPRAPCARLVVVDERLAQHRLPVAVLFHRSGGS